MEHNSKIQCTTYSDSRPDPPMNSHFSSDSEDGNRAGKREAVSLGNYKGVCWPTSRRKRPSKPYKISRFKLQRFARENCNNGGLKICMWKIAFGSGAVSVKGQRSETIEGTFDKTRLGNLSVCGSHICPVCGPRIAQRRRLEVEQTVEWGKGQGLIPVMLTLTTRHGPTDRLDILIQKQRKALRKWKQHRTYQSAKKQIPHIISAFEETHGTNGWHPHIHLLMFIKADTDAKALRLIASLRKAWTASAKSEGLESGRAGFKATIESEETAKKAAKYLTKEWGIAEEMTLSFAKKAKDKSRTPVQLLADAYNGDSQALALWQVWANAVKGKSVLRFSPGLKDLVGIGEKTDEEIAEVEEQKDEVIIDMIDGGIWEQAKASKGFDRDRLLAEAKQGKSGVRKYFERLGCYIRSG